MLKLSSSKSDLRETGIVVRAARAQDAGFIDAMARTTFLAYGSYDRYLEDWFGNDAVTTSIAELDGRSAGFSMITAYADPEHPRENVADLIAIAVANELRSRGIGGRLLAHALAFAESSPSKPREVWLVVAEDNARAQRLFQSAGFRLGKRPRNLSRRTTGAPDDKTLLTGGIMKLDRREFLATAASVAAAKSASSFESSPSAADALGVREDFPAAAESNYLNTPYIGPPPRAVEEAGVAFVRSKSEDPILLGAMLDKANEVRQSFSSLFGAKPEDVSFLFATSEGENIVAEALDLKPGDNVVAVGLDKIEAHTVDLAHHLRKRLIEQGLTVRTPKGNGSSIVSFEHGSNPKAVESLFAKERIKVSFRENGRMIRVGAALFNNKSDIDHLLETTQKI